ncbi:MAG: hypothetical protein MJE68_32090, partial [Proteobacteria bacterium]|nr:hypothetical protein [Pseudomonadota bacterium]
RKCNERNFAASTISEVLWIGYTLSLHSGSRETIVEAVMARKMGRKVKCSETAAHSINWRGNES